MTGGWRIGVLAVAMALLVLGGGRAAMAEMVLCSQFEGRLVRADGSPAAGIPVRRDWRWSFRDRTGSDSVTTDAEGRFRFDEVRGRSMLGGLLPHEPRILQTVTAGSGGDETILWRSQKANYAPWGEFGGSPRRLICTYGATPDYDGPAYGTCRFE
ncbi:DUF6795 domain-containing protein [Frigidibacter oleivorans]|uniref:DUF6795 domain-containing protein n=1 Tax=Frigidibacter oleivorans TaxID=2487129 RepID=UPI000F8CE351|nr:DUF6795 domain-containing protein [Frigidibacter oleivorans]